MNLAPTLALLCGIAPSGVSLGVDNLRQRARAIGAQKEQAKSFFMRMMMEDPLGFLTGEHHALLSKEHLAKKAESGTL